VTYGEFVERQAAIIRPVLRLLALVLLAYRLLPLNRKQWRQLLAQVYPVIDRARRESSDLARKFYDAERRRRLLEPEIRGEPDDDEDYVDLTPALPGGDRIKWTTFDEDDWVPVDLEPYFLEWFVEAMEPAREGMSEESSADSAIQKFIALAEKEIENANRRTILRAVDNDPKVIGWARVQGGEDSCAFCLMLISRGPVYNNPSKAGLQTDKVTAVELWKRIESGNDAEAEAAYDGLMTRWHPNCDCKAVPVFDRSNWAGRDAYLEAERLWKEATRGYRGREAFNAFRRFVEKRAKELLEGEVIPLRRAA